MSSAHKRPKRAVRGLSLGVKRGECFGLLGEYASRWLEHPGVYGPFVSRVKGCGACVPRHSCSMSADVALTTPCVLALCPTSMDTRTLFRHTSVLGTSHFFCGPVFVISTPLARPPLSKRQPAVPHDLGRTPVPSVALAWSSSIPLLLLRLLLLMLQLLLRVLMVRSLLSLL